MKTIAEVFIESVELEIRNREEDLGHGSATSFEEYRYAVGIMDGLGRALDTFKSLVNRSVEIDEDED